MKFILGVIFGFYVAIVGVDNFSNMVENFVMAIKQSVKADKRPMEPVITPPIQQPAPARNEQWI